MIIPMIDVDFIVASFREFHLNRIRIEAARRHEEKCRAYESLALDMGSKAIAHGKCASCGSRKFQQHNSALVCSYCRSPQ